ncbi:MFS transporter [Micrococcus endophyticus]|uniref:MFS transporter n=1 Tax=Micrococcus endophyticus TaxID=455343 RepID=UPI002003F5F9|nr:MFS transporter [Micrococcus endophyticus]MCK6090171.1 MFS transporter [Micrococcus endophyticus]
MPSASPSSPAARRDVVRARWAATLAFLTNGAMLGALIPHYPQAKDAFGLDADAFGLLVVSLAGGAAAAGSLPAPVLRRWGSRRVVLAGSVAIAAVVTAAGLVVDAAAGAGGTGSAPWAGAVWLFAALLCAAGVGDAIVDTAQNAQGLTVQTRLARPVLTSMHAGWSLGAGLGAALGALAVGAGLPAGLHLGLNGVACVAVLAAAGRRFLPDDGRPVPDDVAPGDAAAGSTEGAAAGPARSAAWLALVPVVVIAMAGFGVEEFGTAWTALFLQSERGLDPAAAGLGAGTLLLAQFAGRLVGDRVLHALGRRRALAGSLTVVVAGLALVLTAPAAPAVFAGLALAGLGCAVVVPTAYALGDEVPGLPPRTGLAVVSWLMRVAGIGLSPLVGLLATGMPLAAALAVFPALAALGLLGAWVLGRRRRRPSHRGRDTPPRPDARGVS